MLPSFPYSLVLPGVLCSSASSSVVGASLSVEEHDKIFLVSPNHTFSCGFYKVNGHGSKVSFNHDGNLLLHDVGGSTVWESKTSLGKAATIHLLESGNLVIKNSSNEVMWESFDSPTDTLLPSQTFTKNKKLVSSHYNLFYDNDNVLNLMYDGPQVSSIYWPNPDNDVFKKGRATYNSSRIAVLNEKGRFISSDGFNIVTSDFGYTGVQRRLTITQDGNLKIYSLNVSNRSWIVTWKAMIRICKVHGLCGNNGICEQLRSPQCYCPPGYEMVNPQNWTRGCQPVFNNNINQTKEEVKFVRLHHTDFHGFDMYYNETPISFHDCKKYCLNASSCLGFSYRFTGEGKCFPKSLLFNGYRSSTFIGSFYLKISKHSKLSIILAAKQSHLICKKSSEIVAGPTYVVQKSDTKLPYYFAFFAVLGGLEMFFALTTYLFLRSKQNIPQTVMEGYKQITNQFRRLSYRELKEATGNFKEEIRRSGSGAVYRGLLNSSQVVAVKKLTNAAQGDEEFRGEITLIAGISHINLLRIWGFCSEGKHKLLVYEYMENGSLDKHLFSTTNSKPLLGWSQRFKIALGIARGLAYLHHECLEWIVQCDVKPENILLFWFSKAIQKRLFWVPFLSYERYNRLHDS